MLTSNDLNRAVERGIITSAQRDALISLTGKPQADTDDDQLRVDAFGDENIRLIGGGNDLFVTIGIVLVGTGLFFALSTFFADQVLMLGGLMALASWALAEIVTRQHRMRLSSTVLALLFGGTTASILGTWVWDSFGFANVNAPQQILGMRNVIGTAALSGFGALIVASLVYFWRFRVPILSAIIAISLTALAFIFTTLFLYDGVIDGSVAMPSLAQLPELLRGALFMPLICGLIVFGVAVALDLHDRERVSIWSDCAFWLHVVSAPLLVHPLFIMATGQDVVIGTIEPGMDATIYLAILIAVFTYTALAIDRRSLLIPTLGYFGVLGIYYLVNGAANTTGIPPFALILLVVGSLVMMFGAGWQRIRRLIIAPTLPTSVLNRLPPIRV